MIQWSHLSYFYFRRNVLLCHALLDDVLFSEKSNFKLKPLSNSLNSRTPFSGHPEERPPPLERPLNNINLNKNILISTPERDYPF